MKSFMYGRSLLLFATAVAAAFFVFRLGVGFFVWHTIPATFRSDYFGYWWIDTGLGAFVLAGAAFAGYWFLARTRTLDRETARQVRLAELGLLSGGMAHEIRNALNAMNVHIAITRKSVDAGDMSKCKSQIDRLEEVTQDLEQLTTDFLVFARPARDELEEVDLRALIGDILSFVALDMEQSRVEIKTHFASDVPAVFVDVAKLKRALLNIIINARQAMPDGGTLSIDMRPLRKREVTIEIADTGCGIPQNEVERAFETFFSTKSEGTGLGLAIVKRTIEDCGGRVTLRSKENEGTTIQIVLPAAVDRLKTLRRAATR